MNEILMVNTLELMRLWGELTECYHGVNGFGGDTAEIYAYRLQPYSPAAHGEKPIKRLVSEYAAKAASALFELCELFSKENDCKIEIDGEAPSWWMCGGRKLEHRVHVKVIRKK